MFLLFEIENVDAVRSRVGYDNASLGIRGDAVRPYHALVQSGRADHDIHHLGEESTFPASRGFIAERPIKAALRSLSIKMSGTCTVTVSFFLSFAPSEDSNSRRPATHTARSTFLLITFRRSSSIHRVTPMKYEYWLPGGTPAALMP